MSSDFDIAALTYDQDFTYSQIGKLQREKVWEYLDSSLKNQKNLRILELNCGTAEDALLFSKKGHLITATDISEKMLDVGRNKLKSKNVIFKILDLREIEKFQVTEKYDLVFSNFGGLNCVNKDVLEKLCQNLMNFIKPHGKFIAVIMPKFCFWESFYFISKRRFKEAFRRSQDYALANVSGEIVKTWYYNPKEIKSLITEDLECRKLKPIGLFVPPSYLESFFKKRKRLLHCMCIMDNLIAKFSWQAILADHYYIEFKAK